MNETQKRRHIRNGGRALLPQWRMRQIRWEEALLRSKLKRQGIVDIIINHTNCHCGILDCLGIPFIKNY